MKIAVDCRYLGKSGIGRVCQGMIDNLDYDNDQIYLIGDEKKLGVYEKAVIIPDNTQPYSLKGLLKFNTRRINKECDALIIPNFLVPFGIRVPIFSVMHDLIFLDVKETVNGKMDYLIKRYLLKRGMKKSKAVSCVSEFTKSRCEFHFPKYSHKCFTNYNGLTDDLLEYGKEHRVNKKNNTIVFVGNVKRHKGLVTLLNAFSMLKDTDLELKIIGEKQGFITGLDLDESAYKNVVFTGKLDNESLFYEIQHAKFLVQPSIYEGFGIPPLEALYLGTQPIVSDIEVFREIYDGLPVIFFKTDDCEDLAKAIMQAQPLSEDCRDTICNKYNYKLNTLKILSYLKS